MAGLIPQNFVDALLDRIDIVEVVDRRVKLKKTGKNYSALCPFHEEKTPSFSVNPEKQFYYCFGCGAGGNALGFIMDYENLEFPQAVETLAQMAGMEVPREQHSGPARHDQRKLYALMEQAARFYQQQLRRHPQRAEAVDYLKGRGLSGQIAARFGLGYAPPGRDHLRKALGSDEATRKLLQRAGLLVESESQGGYDRFRQRLIFPIHDQRGRVIAFGGRVLGDALPKYLNSPETEIFHKNRELYGLHRAQQDNRHLQSLIVVEGYMDVIALAQFGITNATATLGTATNTEHLNKIFRRCAQAVFCFDGDDAGRKAAARALEAALPVMEDGRQVRFLLLPEGEDPDTLVRKKGAEHFQSLVENSTPLEQYMFDHLARELDLESMADRARLSKLALPLLSKMPEGVYRRLMLEELAKRTGLSVEKLPGLTVPAPAYGERAGHAPAAARPGPRKREPLRQTGAVLRKPAESALTLLLHQPQLALKLDNLAVLQAIEDEHVQLLVELLQVVRANPESTTPMLQGRWYGTREGELLNQLAGREQLIPAEDAEGIEKQFSATIRLLLQHDRRQMASARVAGIRDKNYVDISAEEKLEIERELRESRSLEEARGKDQRGQSH